MFVRSLPVQVARRLRGNARGRAAADGGPRGGLLAGVLLLSACASEPGLFDPGRPQAAGMEMLQAAEQSYRAGQPYAEPLATIRQDPVASFWFTRMLVRDLVTTREARAADGESRKERMDRAKAELERRHGGAGPDEDLVRSFQGDRDPVEARALAGLDAMGAAAVPCLIEDLARSRQTFLRQLGIEVLARLGDAARQPVDELSRSSVAVERRTAARILGEWGEDPAAAARLQQLAVDADYTVRAASLRALANRSPAIDAFLRRQLVADDDPFVRRAAAQALALSPAIPTVEALIDYLERCKSERDERGVDAAQQSLQAIAGTRGDRSSAAWRTWARTYQPDKDD